MFTPVNPTFPCIKWGLCNDCLSTLLKLSLSFLSGLGLYLCFYFSGVHHKGKNCKPEEKRDAVQQTIDRNKQHLFPNVISIGSYSGIKLRDPKPNGGWGDLRDRQLCISFINSESEKH